MRVFAGIRKLLKNMAACFWHVKCKGTIRSHCIISSKDVRGVFPSRHPVFYLSTSAATVVAIKKDRQRAPETDRVGMWQIVDQLRLTNP